MKSIPNGRPSIREDEIVEVAKTLRSKWWTTGPKVKDFEASFASYIGSNYALAVNSGTAALELAVAALGFDSGEIITTPFTFVATSNAVLYAGLTPVFVDIDPHTLNIDPAKIVPAITPQTKAILYVDYAGQPCDIEALRRIAEEHNLYLIEDASHAIGAAYKGQKVGTLADLTTFSFHPVKNISTGEGGMVTTSNEELYRKMLLLRNHGLDKADKRFGGPWSYDLKVLGRNFRLTDFQSTLGVTQLQQLDSFNASRRAAAQRYKERLSSIAEIEFPSVLDGMTHSWHLFVILLKGVDRNALFAKLAEKNVAANVHYIPIYKFSYYQKFNFNPQNFPVTEDVFSRILTLPLYNDMTLEEVDYVADVLHDSIKELKPRGGDV